MDVQLIAGVVSSLLVTWAVLVAVLWVVRPRHVALRELARVVPEILRLVRDLLTDHTVPMGPRLALLGLLAWLVSPIDLIPEFIPVLGPLDDVVVAVIVLRYVRRQLGDGELRRRWRGTPQGFELLRGVLGADRPQM